MDRRKERLALNASRQKKRAASRGLSQHMNGVGFIVLDFRWQASALGRVAATSKPPFGSSLTLASGVFSSHTRVKA
jgi:hypothetical protein